MGHTRVMPAAQGAAACYFAAGHAASHAANCDRPPVASCSSACPLPAMNRTFPELLALLFAGFLVTACGGGGDSSSSGNGGGPVPPGSVTINSGPGPPLPRRRTTTSAPPSGPSIGKSATGLPPWRQARSTPAQRHHVHGEHADEHCFRLEMALRQLRRSKAGRGPDGRRLQIPELPERLHELSGVPTRPDRGAVRGLSEQRCLHGSERRQVLLQRRAHAKACDAVWPGRHGQCAVERRDSVAAGRRRYAGLLQPQLAGGVHMSSSSYALSCERCSPASS